MSALVWQPSFGPYIEGKSAPLSTQGDFSRLDGPRDMDVTTVLGTAAYPIGDPLWRLLVGVQPCSEALWHAITVEVARMACLQYPRSY